MWFPTFGAWLNEEMAVCESRSRKPEPHAVIVPFPVQGHINPMMHLAHNLASNGFIITFVNTVYNNSGTVKAHRKWSSELGEAGNERVCFRAIPDGLPEDDMRTDFARLARVTETAMPPSLQKLIQEINDEEEHQVTCLIADFFAPWALDVAQQFHIQTAGFWPGIIAAYALIYHMPDLMARGSIPSNGIPKKQEMVKYFAHMPSLCSANLPWLIGSEADKEFRFQFWLRSISRFRHLRWIVCNSFHDLEMDIINTFPKEAGICSIGPLIPQTAQKETETEKEECLQWLDRQKRGCVIYVSFGSSVVLKEKEVEQLAEGLEATRRPFLWVLRGVEKFLSVAYLERLRERACMPSWVPQARVLSHPSVGCFLTHCGWNSTLESIAAGVPMLCRPCVADQFLNAAYVVDVWKIGVALKTNSEGIVGKIEIEESVQRIMSSDEVQENSRKLKKCAVDAHARNDIMVGSSSINFNVFLNAMKTNM
ncbi:hypothetical protein KI387_019796 [Taxus chinensis]|uniref:Glycosyltransferase n=1 Tax=Taxus chinensis TaxID=29808 RepID=A0AA38G7X6_TAXCH|nr:hypothetical protein KI387_019796 [Taxus chinensis]